jgi:Spy/CpxP family protein refolding chaperone
MAPVALALVVAGTTAFAQTPTQTPPPPAAKGARQAGPGRAGRAGLPPVTANMNPQQLQMYIDTWAVMQARAVLKLTDEQEPNFIARLQRIQAIRRKQMQEHRRLMGELNLLLNSNPVGKPEDIDAHVKALSDAQETEAADLKKAYLDLDAVLTPWQRGRFRQFEEQVERRKVELLGLIKNGTATTGDGGRGDRR